MSFLRNCLDAAMTVSPMTYVKTLAGVSTGLFIGEYLGRKYNVIYRPSFFINEAAISCTKFSTNLGKAFAWLGSYLTQIDLKEITETATALGKPTFDLVKSPLYTLVGYAEKATSYGNKDWMVYCGSALLITVLGYTWYYMSTRYPWLNIWTPALNFYRQQIGN